MSNLDENLRRHREMIEKWAGLGHRHTPCTGHTYPLPGCPAPEVHAQVFPPVQVVPKVTADTRTHILYAVLSGDLTRARELVGTLGPAERRAYLADLTRVINMLWGADL